MRARTHRCHGCGEWMLVSRGDYCHDCRARRGDPVGRRIAPHHPPIDPTALPATCWCEEATVEVPASELQAGRTRSCGRTTCSPAVMERVGS